MFPYGSGDYQHQGRVRPERFFGNKPPRRIIGVETEYNVQNEQKSLSFDTGKYITYQALKAAGIKSIRGYTELGSRIYSDCGHAEHCTPECLGPYQAAAADIASIAIMSSIIEASHVPYRGIYRISGTWLRDEDIGHYPPPNVTNGVHENFMAPSKIAGHDLFEGLMSTYYASRLASMAGTVQNNKYRFSQKVIGIGGDPISWRVDRRTSPGNKPMALALSGDFDTVDEGWMRLETRYADAPLSLAARRHALATTSLMLRVLEHSVLFEPGEFDDIILKRPVEATHRYMSDLKLKSTAETVSGKRINLLNVNEQLAQKILFMCERIDLPDDEVDAANKWVEIYDAFRRSKPHQVDYDPYLIRDYPVTTKHLWLTKTGAFEKGDAEAKTRSMQWDRILPGGNGLKMMEKSSISDPMVDDLKRSAPPTRAHVRGAFVKDQHENKNAIVNSWKKGSYSYGAQVSFGDVYGTSGY